MAKRIKTESVKSDYAFEIKELNKLITLLQKNYASIILQDIQLKKIMPEKYDEKITFLKITEIKKQIREIEDEIRRLELRAENAAEKCFKEFESIEDYLNDQLQDLKNKNIVIDKNAEEYDVYKRAVAFKTTPYKHEYDWHVA